MSVVDEFLADRLPQLDGDVVLFAGQLEFRLSPLRLIQVEANIGVLALDNARVSPIHHAGRQLFNYGGPINARRAIRPAVKVPLSVPAGQGQVQVEGNDIRGPGRVGGVLPDQIDSVPRADLGADNAQCFDEMLSNHA